MHPVLSFILLVVILFCIAQARIRLNFDTPRGRRVYWSIAAVVIAVYIVFYFMD